MRPHTAAPMRGNPNMNAAPVDKFRTQSVGEWLTELLTDADLRATEEPPKRWLNWWRSRIDDFEICSICGRSVSAPTGKVYGSHCRRYPSKDVAETHAVELDFYYSPHGNFSRTYLGAFPEGEAP